MSSDDLANPDQAVFLGWLSGIAAIVGCPALFLHQNERLPAAANSLFAGNNSLTVRHPELKVSTPAYKISRAGMLGLSSG